MKKYICKETITGLIIEFNGTDEEIKQLGENEHIYIKHIINSNKFEVETDNKRDYFSEKDLPVYFTMFPCETFAMNGNMEIARECKSPIKFIDNPKRVFISGPMTGYKNYNFDTFNFYEEVFKKLNIDCVNPVSIARKWLHELIINNKPIDKTSIEFQSMVKEELDELSKCDVIFLLGGWEYSDGAKLELRKAIENNLKIVQEMNSNMFIFSKNENKDIDELI